MSKQEQVLLNAYRSLPDTQKESLSDYADFLSQRYAIDAEPLPEHPLEISRPNKESVVKAVKRLSKTYPMLDTKVLFEKTSSYMMRNMMHGEDSIILIDEMEIFFKESYQQHQAEKE